MGHNGTAAVLSNLGSRLYLHSKLPASDFSAATLVAGKETPASLLSPTNPFFTAQYADALRTAGFEAWSLVGRDESGDERGAVGFITRGRLNSGLLLPSM